MLVSDEYVSNILHKIDFDIPQTFEFNFFYTYKVKHGITNFNNYNNYSWDYSNTYIKEFSNIISFITMSNQIIYLEDSCGVTYVVDPSWIFFSFTKTKNEENMNEK